MLSIRTPWLATAATFCLVVGSLSAGCRCTTEHPGEKERGDASGIPSTTLASEQPRPLIQKLTDLLPSCEIDHRGVFLDLSSKATEGRSGYSVLTPSAFHEQTLEASRWARVDGKTLRQVYVQSWSGPVFVQTRIHGMGSRAVVVRIDGKLVGTLRLTRDKIEVLNTRETKDSFEPGRHVVQLQFYRTKNKTEPKADVDWIRIGRPDHVRGTYTPALLRDMIRDKLIGGQAMQAVALHPRSRITCTVGVIDGMHLKGLIGHEGAGETQTEIDLREPGKPPMMLQSSKLGGEDNQPVPLDLDLSSYAGRIVHVSFEVGGGPRGSSVLFGGVTFETAPAPTPMRHKARAVVIIVLSGADMRHLPPYSKQSQLPNFTRVARESVVFYGHRANTSSTTGQVAALLTGLSPLADRVADPGAKLSERFPTLATLTTNARSLTAMFTAVPTTSEAFGFRHGWSQYQYFSPVSGTSAYATWTHATKWLENLTGTTATKPPVLMLHARGVHPPWILRHGQADKLPPEEYTGVLTGRKAGEFFAQRRTWRPSRRYITPHDFVRAEGYATAVLHNADLEFAHLIDALEAKKLWEDAMVIITSDVAMGSADHVPFDDGVRLGEDLLRLPLLIRFPRRQYAGTVVRSPTSTTDIAPTVLGALGLKSPKTWSGRDLYQVTVHPQRYAVSLHLAVLGRAYMTSFGPYTLIGKHPRRPKLCVLNAEYTCEQDLRDKMPILAAFLWRSTYRRFRDAERLFSPRPTRQPATTTNPDVTSALTVWGNMEEQ